MCLVAQWCPTLCNPMDCSPPGSSVLGDSPSKHTGVDCHALLQGIFPTQGSNPNLPHCRQILYWLSHQGSPRTLEWAAYPSSRGSSQPRNWTGVSCIAGRFFTSWSTRKARMCNTAKKKRYKWNLFTTQKQTQRSQNQTCGYQRGNMTGSDKLRDWDWHIHMTIYKIDNRDLLYSRGNSTQYSVIIYMGKESEIYIHIYIHTHTHTIYTLSLKNTDHHLSLNES